MLAQMIVGHMIGDYLLQNDWMALNKKRSSFHCAVHCLLWTAAVLACCGSANLWLAAWLFLTHFAIDRTQFVPWYMGVVGQAGFRDRMAPWSGIAVDNTWHLLTLIIAALATGEGV